MLVPVLVGPTGAGKTALATALKMKVGWAVFSGELAKQISVAGMDPASLHQVTAIFNLPAIIIVAIVTVLLVVGIRESAGFNNIFVFLKIGVVLHFIFGAARAITRRFP